MDPTHVETALDERPDVNRVKKVTRREALGMLGATGAALSLARLRGEPDEPQHDHSDDHDHDGNELSLRGGAL